MKEHPILMQGWGVRATLDGRKTQTRRVMKTQPPEDAQVCFDSIDAYQGEGWFFQYSEKLADGMLFNKKFLLPNMGRCPYGQPGDLLWIKETWGHFPASLDEEENIVYRATCENTPNWPSHRRDISEYVVWHPSIFMPKKYARIWRRITDIRAERVQDISPLDATAEGANSWFLENKLSWKYSDKPYPVFAFQQVWDSINKKPRLAKRNPWTRAPEDCYVSYPWENIQETRQHRGLTWYVIGNPYVWAISSEKVDR